MSKKQQQQQQKQISIVQEQEQITEEQEDEFGLVPVCGSNLSSPVDEMHNYLDEIKYMIGERMYVENAD